MFMFKQCSGLSVKVTKNLGSHKCVAWNGTKISGTFFSKWGNGTDWILEIFKLCLYSV